MLQHDKMFVGCCFTVERVCVRHLLVLNLRQETFCVCGRECDENICLTARLTNQAGSKVGCGDLVILNVEKSIAQ